MRLASRHTPVPERVAGVFDRSGSRWHPQRETILVMRSAGPAPHRRQLLALRFHRLRMGWLPQAMHPFAARHRSLSPKKRSPSPLLYQSLLTRGAVTSDAAVVISVAIALLADVAAIPILDVSTDASDL